MGGLLSQALANAQAAEGQITGLSGLPSAAEQVQADSANLIATIVPEIQQLQAAVNAFAQQAQPQLKQAQEQAAGDTPLTTVVSTMVAVQNAAASLKATTDGATSNITAAANQVFGYSNQLAAIESQLNSQQAALQSQLSAARDEEAKAQQYYIYLTSIASIFTSDAVAQAAALYLQWTTDVNGLEAQVSDLSAQVSQHTMLITATKQLNTDFSDLSTKIGGVKNAVDFLSGEISTIITDAGETNASRAAIQAYIMAAEQQVATLAVDAS